MSSLCAEKIVNRNFKCGGGAATENASCAHRPCLLPDAQQRFPNTPRSVDCFLQDIQPAKQRLKLQMLAGCHCYVKDSAVCPATQKSDCVCVCFMWAVLPQVMETKSSPRGSKKKVPFLGRKFYR